MTFIACAAMLTSAIALNSCKSEEPQGSFEGEAEVVKTEFAISLPDNVAGGPNKMKSTTVQNAGITDFQGMTGIILVPFATSDSIEGADARLGKNIGLSDLLKTEIDTKASKAKVYSDVSVPLTTASFLFYGRSAAAGTALTAVGKKFQVGSLIPDTATAENSTAADFGFKLDTIAPDYAASLTGTGKGAKLMEYLTKIANAKASVGSKPWWNYPETGDSIAMNHMFATFSSMHGLSSFEVSRVLTDLYRTLKPTMASGLAKAITDSIKIAAYASVNGSDSVILNDLNDYPTELGLPIGAIQMAWDGGEHKFKEGDYTNLANPAKYVFPAQLWYYANSTIKTSNTSKKNEYTSTSATWDEILDTHTSGAAVSTLTRAVAIKDPIQYAVARFDVQVKLADAGGKLADNSDLAEGVAKAVNVGGGLPVTAVLIGGQNHVGYNFKPAAEGEFTVYDTVMAASLLALSGSTYSDKNHTLVLESYTDRPVKVAIEFENTTGVDFYGVGNQLIPKGGKFYVVADLDLSAGAGKTINTPHNVFKQDYITLAKLNLKDLRKAYNTIPDLRTPQLEIGFSVDLSWQTGNTYEIDFE